MHEQIQGFPLSPQQQEIWFLQAETGIEYSLQSAILIEGELDWKTLEKALQTIVDRQEILRTRFVCRPDMEFPLQAIEEAGKVGIEYHCLGASNWQTQLAKVQALFQEFSQQPFDWEKGPLLQLRGVSMTSQAAILMIRLPALCADRITLNNLALEIEQAYAACLTGEELAPPAIQYVDLADWQNELLENEAEVEYWSQRDWTIFSTLNLPFACPEASEFAPQVFAFSIENNVVNQLELLAQQYHTSVAICLQTCWWVLLWRLTERAEIAAGVAFDGRQYEEIKSSLGLLVKYLPIQCQVEANESFAHLLEKVKKANQVASARQEYFSWQKIRKSWEDADLATYLPIKFEFADAPIFENRSGVTFSLYQQSAQLDRFQVKLTCLRQADQLKVELHYNLHYLTAKDIERLAGEFTTLLSNVVTSPEQGIDEFNILSPQERSQLLVEFNQTQTPAPVEGCVHHWFESQCQLTPHNIAVIEGERQLTYAELNAKANQLAHYLQAQGIGGETLVGIYLERSLEMAIAVLGILKAGGAYVPLDPSHPPSRTHFIIEDTQVPILLTQQRLAASLPEHRAEVICLDSDWPALQNAATTNPETPISAECLAYVIYTSGSTGTPKGTLIPHRGLSNYLSWCIRAYEVEKGRGTLVHSPLTFDLTITSFFSPLLVGRSVELLPEDLGIESLHRAFRDRAHLSLIKITPAQLTLLAQQLSPSQVADRTRAFIIGGENLLSESLSFWRQYSPKTQLVNEYGPTETVVGCCAYWVSPEDSKTGSVPIGRPIANTQLYVLNSQKQPVPLGVPGELYIGGAGVARGYLNRPQLNAEKFVPNPFSDQPGAKLYKTGDLVRFRQDGNLEFLGRIDRQVKIRGFRIELGEIENLLWQHPAIREAVVAVKEDASSDRRLVAYVVPQRATVPNNSQLRSYLQQHLPDYMLPATFVQLEKLPLTPNGKIDHQALPEPSTTRPDLAENHVASRTAIEEILVGIWAQVLNLETVGIYDRFFELGGHSLLAMQIVAQLQKAFQVEIAPRRLLEAETIAELAREVEAAVQGECKQYPAINPVPRSGEIPLSFGQQRLWFLQQLEPESAAYNGSAVLRLQGKLDVETLARTLNAIVERHEILRTAFVGVEGHPVQQIVPHAHVALPTVDLKNDPQPELSIQQLAAEEAQRPFDLTQAPLLRVKLLQLGEEDHVLLVTLHHIVSDGWSVGIFIREMTALFAAFSQARPSPLPELPIQYADFAIWQRQWLQAELIETQLAYWKQQLQGAPTVLALPTRKAPTETAAVGGKHFFHLSSELSQGLKTLSRQAGVTLFMTLLAGYNTLLCYYTQQEDILVGSPIANRPRPEMQALIGFFANTLVLRTQLSGNPSFKELLARVKTTALGAYLHQDLPFEKLVAELDLERNLNHYPLFQAWFVLQTLPQPNLELPGLQVKFLQPPNGVVRYHLKLDLTDSPQGISGFLEYKKALFEAATIAQMVEALKTILTLVVEQPDIPLNLLKDKLLDAEQATYQAQAEAFQMTRRQKLKRIKRQVR